VGLSSYLLIGFWYRKKTATDAGKKAFIVNRVGDFGFLLGMLLIVVHFGTLEFHEVAAAASRFSPELAFGTLSAITLLLFVGAAGKSAQIPLYVWLPDAMEGPTPVSALIHAATMVTAGVYMIARNAVLFSHAPETMQIVAVVGAATAIGAATIGLVQNDIKRVLAYSTVSQLGYMMLAMGVGAYASGIFHLYTHAFFKALLFLGSGAVIHALAGEQDIRRMGGLRHDLPLTYWTFLIGALAIAGVPGLSGFFSKDAILFETFASGHTLLWAVGIITSLLTAVYMFRLVFLTFHGERASGGSHLHDAPYPMAVALVILAVGSAAAGWVSLGGRFDEFLQPALEAGPHEASAAGEPHDTRLELVLMGVATAVAVSGIAIAWYLFVRSRAEATRLAERFAGVHRTLERKYYVDELYDAAIVQPVRLMAENGLWKIVDVAGIDRVVNGTASAIASMSAMLRRLQTGSVRAYAASLVLGAVLIVGYYLWT
jgi:NADH-quinone oxidoreductase subunit L